MEIKADDIMTKVDVIEKCVEAAAHPTDRVNRMGCFEDWYDKWFAVGTTFSEDELRNLYAVLKQMFENDNPETETKIEKCSLDDLYRRWDDLVSYAPSVIRSKLMTSRVDTLPNNRVIVSLKKGNYDALASDENRRVLQNFISNIVDQDVHVELVESSLL